MSIKALGMLPQDRRHMAEVKGRAAWRRRRAIRLYRKAHALDPKVPLGSICLVLYKVSREDGQTVMACEQFSGVSAVAAGYPSPTATTVESSVTLQAPIASHGLDS